MTTAEALWFGGAVALAFRQLCFGDVETLLHSHATRAAVFIQAVLIVLSILAWPLMLPLGAALRGLGLYLGQLRRVTCAVCGYAATGRLVRSEGPVPARPSRAVIEPPAHYLIVVGEGVGTSVVCSERCAEMLKREGL